LAQADETRPLPRWNPPQEPTFAPAPRESEGTFSVQVGQTLDVLFASPEPEFPSRQVLVPMEEEADHDPPRRFSVEEEERMYMTEDADEGLVLDLGAPPMVGDSEPEPMHVPPFMLDPQESPLGVESLPPWLQAEEPEPVQRFAPEPGGLFTEEAGLALDAFFDGLDEPHAKRPESS